MIKRNRKFVEKLQGKLINLSEIIDGESFRYGLFSVENNKEYKLYCSKQYSGGTYELILLNHPYVLVVATHKSSIQILASDGFLYWLHLSGIK